jgi:hypothetical protein
VVKYKCYAPAAGLDSSLKLSALAREDGTALFEASITVPTNQSKLGKTPISSISLAFGIWALQIKTLCSTGTDRHNTTYLLQKNALLHQRLLDNRYLPHKIINKYIRIGSIHPSPLINLTGFLSIS